MEGYVCVSMNVQYHLISEARRFHYSDELQWTEQDLKVKKCKDLVVKMYC